MEALRHEALEGVEIGAGRREGGLDRRGEAGIEALGRDLAKSASGSAGERRKGLQIREETLFRALRGIGTLALLVDPCEEPRVLQQSLAHLGVGAAVGRIEGLPLARGEALGQLAGTSGEA